MNNLYSSEFLIDKVFYFKEISQLESAESIILPGFRLTQGKSDKNILPIQTHYKNDYKII